MEKLLTAKDLQDVFSCSKQMAYSILHSPGFPTVTINNRLYVEESELKQWLKANRGRIFAV